MKQEGELFGLRSVSPSHSITSEQQIRYDTFCFLSFFPFCSDHSVAVDSAEFWSRGFVVRTINGNHSPARPTLETFDLRLAPALAHSSSFPLLTFPRL